MTRSTSAATLLLAAILGCLLSTKAPAQPAAPFQLTPAEQAFLDQVLATWEQESAKIKSFSCPFTRWTYNAFAPAPNIAFSIEEGKVSYQKPDKGSFKIDTVRQWRANPVAPGQAPAPGAPPAGQHVLMDPEKDGVVGDHWVSDGKWIYQYRPRAKELAVTPIPPEMQGEQIVNGPFPFLFGAKKDDLKRRYWMRVHQNPNPNVIHLVAMPKTQQDAANYKAVELQLDRRTLLPAAMKVYDPTGANEAFAFHMDKVSTNSVSDRIRWSALFKSPRVPWGWKRVVNDPGARQAAGAGAARR